MMEISINYWLLASTAVVMVVGFFDLYEYYVESENIGNGIIGE